MLKITTTLNQLVTGSSPVRVTKKRLGASQAALLFLHHRMQL